MNSELREEMQALGQSVLVLQGGGALGAYQVGVYEALSEAGVEPDWIVGTSIGAINAGIIAGSPKGERLDRLCEFWKRVENAPAFSNHLPGWLAATARNAVAMTSGVPAFFRPQPAAFFNPHLPLGPDAAGYYSTRPLSETLEDLIDFDQIKYGVGVGFRYLSPVGPVRIDVARPFNRRWYDDSWQYFISLGYAF